MTRNLRWLLVPLLLGVVSVSVARDTRQIFPIQDALARNGTFKDNVADDVPLYFGKAETPKVLKTLVIWTFERKTNSLTRTDKEACEVAFISAAFALQRRAREDGANAVINIKSVRRGEVIESESEYLCGAGDVAAGVTLRGTLAKIVQ